MEQHYGHVSAEDERCSKALGMSGFSCLLWDLLLQEELSTIHKLWVLLKEAHGWKGDIRDKSLYSHHIADRMADLEKGIAEVEKQADGYAAMISAQEVRIAQIERVLGQYFKELEAAQNGLETKDQLIGRLQGHVASLTGYNTALITLVQQLLQDMAAREQQLHIFMQQLMFTLDQIIQLQQETPAQKAEQEANSYVENPDTPPVPPEPMEELGDEDSMNQPAERAPPAASWILIAESFVPKFYEEIGQLAIRIGNVYVVAKPPAGAA